MAKKLIYIIGSMLFIYPINIYKITTQDDSNSNQKIWIGIDIIKTKPPHKYYCFMIVTMAKILWERKRFFLLRLHSVEHIGAKCLDIYIAKIFTIHIYNHPVPKTKLPWIPFKERY